MSLFSNNKSTLLLENNIVHKSIWKLMQSTVLNKSPCNQLFLSKIVLQLHLADECSKYIKHQQSIKSITSKCSNKIWYFHHALENLKLNLSQRLCHSICNHVFSCAVLQSNFWVLYLFSDNVILNIDKFCGWIFWSFTQCNCTLIIFIDTSWLLLNKSILIQ